MWCESEVNTIDSGRSASTAFDLFLSHCNCNFFRSTVYRMTSWALGSAWPTPVSVFKRRARTTTRSGWHPRPSPKAPRPSTPEQLTCGASPSSYGSSRQEKYPFQTSPQWKRAWRFVHWIMCSLIYFCIDWVRKILVSGTLFWQALSSLKGYLGIGWKW